jgi:hypothetical protein
MNTNKPNKRPVDYGALEKLSAEEIEALAALKGSLAESAVRKYLEVRRLDQLEYLSRLTLIDTVLVLDQLKDTQSRTNEDIHLAVLFDKAHELNNLRKKKV